VLKRRTEECSHFFLHWRKSRSSQAWCQIHGTMSDILAIIDYVGRIDCWKSSCTPTSIEIEQPWAWACNQSLRHAFYAATSHIELVSHNTYPLAIERNEWNALIVLDMSCAFVHTWRFSFEQGVCIMLFGVKHILGWLVKEEVCQFDLLKVSVMNCKISQWVCDVDGRIQTPNQNFSLGD